MRVDYRGERKDVDIRQEDDVTVITLDGATWRMRTMLSPKGVTLTDADSGIVLYGQDLASLGIRYRDGDYFPEAGCGLEQFLTGFAIAWIILHPRQ